MINLQGRAVLSCREGGLIGKFEKRVSPKFQRVVAYASASP
jgi:hypothetical protein